jgi:hypothetical protein
LLEVTHKSYPYENSGGRNHLKNGAGEEGRTPDLLITNHNDIPLSSSLLFDITGQNGTSGDDIFYGVIPCSILLTAQLLHSRKRA